MFTSLPTSSCQRYAEIVTSLPEPEPLRLRYRDEILAMVRDFVVEGRADIGENVAGNTDPDVLTQLQEHRRC